MKISDIITAEIIKMLNESEMNTAEIQRNELASLLGCAPSQINYVLSSRFTPEHGYIIESRRGGGGYIKIRRVVMSKTSALMHIINSIDRSLTQQEAGIIINNLIDLNIINTEVAKLLKIATNDKVLNLPVELKDNVRTRILKNMLINLI